MDSRDRFIVMTSTAKMPLSCKGRYRRVAIVEVDRVSLPFGVPRMISSRAKGVLRIVEDLGNLNVGKTKRGAYQKAYSEAEEKCKRLNNSA